MINSGLFKTSTSQSKKRFKTEANETVNKNESTRYKNLKIQEDHESKSLQKSHEISLFDDNFWKKKSMNARGREREYTTEARGNGKHVNNVFHRY